MHVLLPCASRWSGQLSWRLRLQLTNYRSLPLLSRHIRFHSAASVQSSTVDVANNKDERFSVDQTQLIRYIDVCGRKLQAHDFEDYTERTYLLAVVKMRRLWMEQLQTLRELETIKKGK